jgi:site-specific recombinase XerD
MFQLEMFARIHMQQLRLLGKGRKMCGVPLMDNIVQLVREYLRENHLEHLEQFDQPLFPNHATNACHVREFVIFFKSIWSEPGANFKA